MDRIYYLGFYDSEANAVEGRSFVPAARNKMDYLADAIASKGKEVTIVSASATKLDRSFPAKEQHLRHGVSLILFRTLPSGSKYRRIASVVLSRFKTFQFLVTRLGNQDTLIVYHSLAYMIPVYVAHRLRRFRLILEVEEIYADQTKASIARSALEMLFLRTGDAYILSTGQLSGLVNRKSAPELTLLGSYQEEPRTVEARRDGRFHAVYAGVIDHAKGAFRVVEAARYLGANYHLHVIGFGNSDELALLRDRIHEVQQLTSCNITYDGLLHGEKYAEFLQHCDVGIVAQKNDEDFVNSSFPSKILPYLANGLTVVCGRFDSVTDSVVGRMITYVEGNSPRHLAEAIARAARTPTDGRNLVQALDSAFKEDLDTILDPRLQS